MPAIDFLKTPTSKEKLAVALEVLREFKTHESDHEWAVRPFIAWMMFEMLEEYLDHLVNGAPLSDDTQAVIKGVAP